MLNTKKLFIRILENLPMLRTGMISIGEAIAANSYSDFEVTFDSPMLGTPTVLCTVYSTSQQGGVGSVTAAVYSYSSTGFTCRVFNGDTSPRQPAVLWVAFYI